MCNCVYLQIGTVASGRVRTVQVGGGGADDARDEEDGGGRVARWREERETRTAWANVAQNMPATSEIRKRDMLYQTITQTTKLLRAISKIINQLQFGLLYPGITQVQGMFASLALI